MILMVWSLVSSLTHTKTMNFTWGVSILNIEIYKILLADAYVSYCFGILLRVPTVPTHSYLLILNITQFILKMYSSFAIKFINCSLEDFQLYKISQVKV